MFIVLYRWRVKPNHERQFSRLWSERTAYLLETYDSLGSRLHRGSDGIWYGYAQWKSAEQRRQAFAAETRKTSESSLRFQEAVAEEFPEIELDIVSDYLVFSQGE